MFKIGDKINMLTVLEYIPGDYKRISDKKYKCICDCGNYCIKTYKHLIMKDVISLELGD